MKRITGRSETLTGGKMIYVEHVAMGVIHYSRKGFSVQIITGWPTNQSSPNLSKKAYPFGSIDAAENFLKNYRKPRKPNQKKNDKNPNQNTLF